MKIIKKVNEFENKKQKEFLLSEIAFTIKKFTFRKLNK